MNEKRITLSALREDDARRRDEQGLMTALERDIMKSSTNHPLRSGGTTSQPAPNPPRDANSADMTKAREVLSNGVTQAHGDACTALDKIVEDARVLFEKITGKVEERKKKLQEEGQKIAEELEAAMRELTRTLEWVEKQGPRLRKPEMPETKPTEN